MGKVFTKDNQKHTSDASSSSNAGFCRLQWTYLAGYLLAGAGDHIQNSFRYALYDSYGVSSSNIERLQAVSYGSALVFGTFAASLADRFGRRLACLLCGLFYTIYCILINFSPIWVLIIASIFWGIGNALFNTVFEAWLIQENKQRGLDTNALRRILRTAYVVLALIAVLTGLLAQLLANLGGYSIPFIGAIVLFCLMAIIIWQFWSENYGNKIAKFTTSFISAFQILRSDPRIVLLALCLASFDAAYYIFLIEWTPGLTRTTKGINDPQLPLGFIFAIFMTFDLIGSLVFGLLAKLIRIQSFMIVVFLLAAMGLMIPFIVPHAFTPILCGYCLFTFGVGIFRPSAALLRSLYIPNEVRATMMTYIRIPQFILMLIVLLAHFTISTVFILCFSFVLLAMILMIILRSLKLPEDPASVNETQIILDEPSSPLFQMKRPQIRPSSSASLVPQVSTKSDSNDPSISSTINEDTPLLPQTE